MKWISPSWLISIDYFIGIDLIGQGARVEVHPARAETQPFGNRQDKFLTWTLNLPIATKGGRIIFIWLIQSVRDGPRGNEESLASSSFLPFFQPSCSFFSAATFSSCFFLSFSCAPPPHLLFPVQMTLCKINLNDCFYRTSHLFQIFFIFFLPVFLYSLSYRSVSSSWFLYALTTPYCCSSFRSFDISLSTLIGTLSRGKHIFFPISDITMRRL